MSEDEVFVWLLDKYRAVNHAGNIVYQAKLHLPSHKKSDSVFTTQVT